MNQLTKRQQQIVQFLDKKENASANQIAEFLHVSAKTVRNEIGNINLLLPNSILSLMSQGYQLNKEKDGYEKLKGMIQEENDPSRNFVLLKKLMEQDTVDFHDLCMELYLSESTLLRTIDEVNSIIRKRYPDVQIIKKGSSVSMNGTEKERRKISTYIFSRELGQYNFDVQNYQAFFTTIDLKHIHAYTLSFLNIHQIALKDIELMSFVIHVSIMIERIHQGNIIVNIDGFDTHQKSYELAVDYYNGLVAFTNVLFNENEIQYLAMLFAGKLPVLDDNEIQKLYDLTKHILTSVNDCYNINLLTDQKLIDNLAVHFYGLKNRMQTNSFLSNPLINDIRRNFPFLYDISVYMAEQLQDYFQVALYEDEIGYIALHLMGSAERLHAATEKRIVIVSTIGKSGINYYQERLRNIHEYSIHIVAVISAFDLKAIAEYNPHLVISFSELPKSQYPVYVSRNILSDEEIEEIYSILRRGYKDDSCYSLFEEDLFFLGTDANTKEEVIHFLCEEAMKRGYIDNEFERLVLERDKVAPLAYGNLFAIPHPIKKEAHRDAVAVAVLKENIVWNGQKVRIVFMICSAKNSRNNFEDLYEKFVSLLNSREKVRKLIKATSYKEFMRLFMDNE